MCSIILMKQDLIDVFVFLLEPADHPENMLIGEQRGELGAFMLIGRGGLPYCRLLQILL